MVHWKEGMCILILALFTIEVFAGASVWSDEDVTGRPRTINEANTARATSLDAPVLDEGVRVASKSASSLADYLTTDADYNGFILPSLDEAAEALSFKYPGSGLTMRFALVLGIVWGGIIYLLFKLFRSPSWWSILVLMVAVVAYRLHM